MGIVDEDVARVRDATDIGALVGERVALKRVGRRLVGLCPFHAEKTPSFSVNPELGVYHCFGCQESGDAITFVRRTEGVDFPEAVERLAARAGVALRYDRPEASRERRRRDRLIEAVGEAVAFYHRILLERPDGGMARAYLRARGFDGDAARRFQLGWAPEAFDALARHLHDRGFTRDEINGAGLGFVNRAEKVQDFFRSRLLFPILDRSGNPVGFGARTLTGGPKYKNSPDSAIYHKSRLLYGLSWAKSEIAARDEVVICEGYTDVMGFVLAGVPHAVATCGTALTDEHVEVLTGLTRRMVLAYDSDRAGQLAAERWYQWEQRFGVRVRVAALPPGRDPADVYRDDPAGLGRAVADAAPLLGFKVDRMLAAADLSGPEGRARAAEVLVPVLAEHPSELVREGYIQTVAGTVGFDHQWFKEAIARQLRARARHGGTTPPGTGERHLALDARRAAPSTPGGARPGDGATTRAARVDRREADALRWALHEPEMVAGWIDASLFTDPVARAAFELLARSADYFTALDASEGPVRALLERLSVEEPEVDGEPETVGARLVVNTVAVPAELVRERLVHDGDVRAMELTALLDAMRAARADGNWRAAEDAAKKLVRWVSEWARMSPTASVAVEERGES